MLCKVYFNSAFDVTLDPNRVRRSLTWVNVVNAEWVAPDEYRKFGDGRGLLVTYCGMYFLSSGFTFIFNRLYRAQNVLFLSQISLKLYWALLDVRNVSGNNLKLSLLEVAIKTHLKVRLKLMQFYRRNVENQASYNISNNNYQNN